MMALWRCFSHPSNLVRSRLFRFSPILRNGTLLPCCKILLDERDPQSMGRASPLAPLRVDGRGRPFYNARLSPETWGRRAAEFLAPDHGSLWRFGPAKGKLAARRKQIR